MLYNFKNGNVYDLRRINIEKYNKYINIFDNPCIQNKLELIAYVRSYDYVDCITGHINKRGCDANMLKNPIWVVRENDKDLLLMYCEKDSFVKLCRDSYKKILDYELENEVKLTWNKGENGYVVSHVPKIHKVLSMHQLITGCHGNGKGTSTISVDHIDRDPLNNTMANLRIATAEEQKANTIGILPNTKRKRNHNARDLPEGITQDMMRKCVVYYLNVYDKKNNKSREYFRVEGHPKIKNWETTKSKDVSIMDKLHAANKVVEDLEKDIFPVSFTESRGLPKSVMLTKSKEKDVLVFDRNVEGVRMNLKMVMPDNYEMETELQKLTDKIREKYAIPEFVL